ncbi:MAG: hypothetical protein HOM21_10530 [Halobacteriovoraceae bacterium]|nr:hypothetical protein [Halobacteriovoraceae bacterium]
MKKLLILTTLLISSNLYAETYGSFTCNFNLNGGVIHKELSLPINYPSNSIKKIIFNRGVSPTPIAVASLEFIWNEDGSVNGPNLLIKNSSTNMWQNFSITPLIDGPADQLHPTHYSRFSIGPNFIQSNCKFKRAI